ncbi:cell division protein FtsI/penicillin-binding protein 2 [Friedmanniella endophytica]|uniref:Beta-lactamase n=1 Tax=Microlunatus kandeliicorticis TaxID=1759536 RepID=A0A7W3IUZ5_9ACTN|nr:penicillin-binding transpeptidase domain-containing protein [Microlunatus kandeliicorticis]MBA8795684.1 cell division protein FtsI/penicillin-binding protein 2 [Microlunatus kandeliicorticis]
MTRRRDASPARRRPLAPWSAAGTAALLLLAGCTGGKVSLPGQGSSEPVAQAATALATAMAKDDVSGVGWSQLSGQQAQNDWTTTTAGLTGAKLAATAGTATRDGSSGSATLQLVWTFPGVPQTWSYPVTAQFTQEGDRWLARWTPTLVQPDLTNGARLVVERTQGTRGTIRAGDGTALMSERPVVRIGIDKTKVKADQAAASASALAKLVDVDAKSFVTAVRNAGPQAFVEAITFRANDRDRPSAAQLAKIDGAVGIDGTAVLSPTRGFAAPLLGQVGSASKEIVDDSKGTIAAGDQVGLSGLERRYESRLGGTPGVTVSVRQPSASASPSAGSSAGGSATPTGGGSTSPTADPSAMPGSSRTVFEAAPKSGRDLDLTLDEDLQRLAESVLAGTKPDSALVAVRPSTGAILAAASGPGADGANSATFGQYPPGSTFKLASSLALLRAGLKPSSPVNCPKTVVVNGQTFKNYNDYPASKVGRIDLQTAVANSCNTAFIGERDELSGSDLADAAASLGIGTDYDVGFPAYFGSVPAPRSENEKAASMIGQGRVQASPMTMAGAIASVQAGRTVLPYLISDDKPTSKADPLTATEASQLKQLLGAVVSEGSGARLQALEPPTVIAKTGTAEFGTDKPPQTHAWMVAAQGDLAVCVFVGLGDSGSGVAGPLLQDFLERAR